MLGRVSLTLAFLLIPISLLAQFPAGVREPLRPKPKPTSEFLAMRASETVLPAAGRTSAWLDARNVPLWVDASGNSPAWEPIGPAPIVEGWGGSQNSGRVSSIAIDPTNTKRIYIGASHGGVWLTTDGGESWRPMADFEASLSFGSICLDPFNPAVIYAGTGESHGSFDSYFGAGLLRSTDSGRTWELLAEDVFAGAVFAKLVASPKVPGLLIAATSYGLFRSLDGGRYWQKLENGHFWDVANSPKQPDVFYACGGAGARSGVFKTTDAGNTWELLGGGLLAPGTFGRTQLAQCRDYPLTLYVSYAVGWGNGIAIYRTDDGGRTWRLLKDAPNYGGGQLWYDNTLGCAPDNPNIVYGAGLSMWRSMDGGLTWQDVGRSYSGGNTHPDWHCHAFDPQDPRTIYGGSDGGMYVSYDRGDTWKDVNNDLATLQFESVAVDPWDPEVAYGGTQDNGTSRRRGSVHWKWIMGGDGGQTAVNYLSPNRVYTSYVNLTIYRSDDYGDSWDWAAGGIDRTGALFYAPYEMDPNDPNILVAGANAVWRTTDGTQSWTKISRDFGNVSALAIAPGRSEVIYAGTRWGRLWVTPNAGKDWYDVSAGLPGVWVTSIAVDPRSPRRAFVTIGGFGHPHVYRTENAGGTWTPVSQGLPDAPANHIVINPARPDDVYLAMDCGVFVSNNGGTEWKRYGVGLPNTTWIRLALNARTGFLTAASHGRSMWRATLPGNRASPNK